MRVYLFLLFSTLIPVKARLQEPKLMLPVGHSTTITSMVFSKDGNTLLTASWDKTVKLWDVKTGILISEYKDSGWVLHVCFSPDEKQILVTSQNPRVKIWDPYKNTVNTVFSGKRFNEFKTSSFSPDGKMILSVAHDSLRVWNSAGSRKLYTLAGHTKEVTSAVFSTDNKYILSGSADSTTRLWNAANGKLIFSFNIGRPVKTVSFTPDQQSIIAIGEQGNVMIGSTRTGKMISEYRDGFAVSADVKKILLYDRTGGISLWDSTKKSVVFRIPMVNDQLVSAKFSNDAKFLIITTRTGNASIWDIETGKMVTKLGASIYEFTPYTITPDGQNVVISNWWGKIDLYNNSDGKLERSFRGYSQSIADASYSPDQKLFVTASNTAKIWDAEKGTLIRELKPKYEGLHSVEFSPDGTNILGAGFGGLQVWDAVTGEQLWYVTTSVDPYSFTTVYSVCYSPDGKLIAGGQNDSTVRIWDASTGKLLTTMRGHTESVFSVAFNPDGKQVASISFDGTLKTWDVENGKLLLDRPADKGSSSVSYSHDGKQVVTACYYKVQVWDSYAGNMIHEFKDSSLRYASFAPGDKTIITSYNNGNSVLWDVASGKKIRQFFGHSNTVSSAKLSPDGKQLLTASEDNTVKVWNVQSGEMMYSLLPLEKMEYLVIDKFNRYDGSEAARKKLYFTCDMEIIELDQVKDQLWVPGLAERIMKQESINAKTLSDLNICGLTPGVKAMETSTGYQFDITPGTGGLGETVLYVNGIEANRYQKEQLKKTLSGYQLLVKRADLQQFFVPGAQNPVTVKSYTLQNGISSRGVGVSDKDAAKNVTPPNLYAVVVGVSDYKGEEMDLKYAAKDAMDFGNALKTTASKMFNIDNKEHVFIYSLTTEKEHYLIPEKNSIKNVLAEISKKAVAGDIFLIFFAGHGVMFGDKKQFYFLTADASYTTAVNSPAEVGISTQELTDWIKPQNIKAQKRILIFDACNSGQAIRDFVKLGDNESNYVAARNDDKGQQIKAIEKLNEKSGLFILSASASNQSAYEFSRYSQGLLTYSLLKAIKQQPDILEDKKYLNVSRWFQAAEKNVSEVVRETGNRQEPQIVSTTDFNIGIVDNDVIQKINLAEEKPLFTSSRFLNKEDVEDNLDLESKIDELLYGFSLKNKITPISYVQNTNAPDAFHILGTYTIKGDDIVCNVVVKQFKQNKLSFEIREKKNVPDKVAEQIFNKVIALVGEQKDKKTAAK